jgi:MFS family permease
VTDVPASPAPGRLWRPYQIYVVGLLLAVTVCNYLDRIVLGVLQEPIKIELGLTDAQLGLLTGPAFALFYSLSGIPAARFAERFNRARLMAIAITAWSAMTALCGVAQNFAQLLLFRIGVGAGEGGCIPISHSILADYFTPKQRGVVMSIVSSAPPLATILAPIIGGLVAEVWGWRMAFLVLGLPGVVLALLVWFTLKEPRQSQPKAEQTKKPATFWADFRWLIRTPAFVFVLIGGAFVGIANAGIAGFTVSFLLRTHEFTLSQAGGIVGMTGAAGLVGAMLGGVLADRFSDDRGRSYVLVPALGSGLAAVAYLVAFGVPDAGWAVPFLLAAAVAYNMKNGPLYAAIQNIVPSTMRATGVAVFMVGATVVGSTVGPLLTGIISDTVAGQRFDGVGTFAVTCPGGRAPEGAAEALTAACAQASASGLQVALLVMSGIFLVSMVFLAIAARTIRINEPTPA